MFDGDNAELAVKDIYKSYLGRYALDGLSLTLQKGEVHVLLGVDGSGKSTLVKILSGVEKPDSGHIYLRNVEAHFSNPRHATRLGVGTVHQETSLVSSMSVADNIFLSYAAHRQYWRLPFIRWATLRETIDDLLDLLGIDIDLQQSAADLNLHQRQLVKIIKALCNRPHILLLDEPTRGMSEIDVSQLFRAIRTLSRSGMSILYVSHRPDEIPRVADRVSVIKDGRNLGTMSADETNLQSVVEMLVAETSQAMALREADRLRREFVSLVSHELRTPLATIQGYAETVISRPWSEEIRQECLEAITSGCERLTELVDNLLDISSLEKGVLRVDQELIDLPDLTNRIVHTGSRNRNRSADIAIHFPDVFPVIKADPKRIEQVLQNFIDNAVKYSSSGNSIRIYGVVDEEQQMIVVTVEDQGMGIPAEHLNRVFERFYRVPSNETVGIEGSGLGLAICKGIVEQHGGRIWARSIPGRGSAFSFSLPLDIEPIVNDALA